MRAGDPFTEWRACSHLRQADIDRLQGAGVPPLALAEGPQGQGYALARDRIVPHRAARRFEFTRHDETAGEEVCSIVVLALDAWGVPVDLVAFHAGATPFTGSWLGRVGLLGEEQIHRRARRPADPCHAARLAPGRPRRRRASSTPCGRHRCCATPGRWRSRPLTSAAALSRP